jgi:hypothetical protein
MSNLGENGKTLTMDVAGGSMFARDAAGIGSGMAFLVGELEKRDPKLNQPLTSVTWMRDIVAKTGGGWVEKTSNYYADYATTGGNQFGLIGGQTNNIPIMQANISKDIFKVVPWSNVLKVPYVDQQRLQGIGRSLDGILDDGIRLNYNKALDLMVYNGITAENIYGLFNNPVVTATTVVAGASTFTAWNKKTPDEILSDINTAINVAWAAAQYDTSAIPNQILIPPTQYGYLVTTIVSSAGNVSILNYLLENNIAKNQGVDLVIVPCRWCLGAGTGSTDRMVSYVNDENKLSFDIPQPLIRAFTQPDATQVAYLTPYVANIGQVKVLYTQCMNYSDGI